MNEQALATQTEYTDDDPNRKHHLRAKDQILDKRAAQRFTAHNELERIQDAINGQGPAEFESWDLKLFKNPVYKPI